MSKIALAENRAKLCLSFVEAPPVFEAKPQRTIYISALLCPQCVLLCGHLLRKHAAEAFLVGTEGFAALVGDAAGGTREAAKS